VKTELVLRSNESMPLGITAILIKDTKRAFITTSHFFSHIDPGKQKIILLQMPINQLKESKVIVEDGLI
jgi:hypothetical protein